MEMGQAICITFIRHCDEYWRSAAFLDAWLTSAPVKKRVPPKTGVISCSCLHVLEAGGWVSALAPALDTGFIVARIADDEVSEAPRVQRHSPNGP